MKLYQICLDNPEVVIFSRFHESCITGETPKKASSCLYRTMGWPAYCGENTLRSDKFAKLIIIRHTYLAMLWSYLEVLKSFYRPYIMMDALIWTLSPLMDRVEK